MGAIIESAPLYLAGFVATLQLLAISGIGAFLIGLLIAAFRISPIAPLRAFATCYTEILRNIPLLLILFF
jgi:glutamate transport system permease protein